MNKKASNTPKPNPATMPMTAETLNAVVDALGALTICISKQLGAEQRSALATDLARVSAQCHATGNTATGTLLADLSRAANG